MADITSVATSLGREAQKRAKSFAETNAVAKRAIDALYTAVGVGVMGAQKARASAKSVHSTIDADGVQAAMRTSVGSVAGGAKKQAARVDGAVTKTKKMVDEALSSVNVQLSPELREA